MWDKRGHKIPSPYGCSKPPGGRSSFPADGGGPLVRPRRAGVDQNYSSPDLLPANVPERTSAADAARSGAGFQDGLFHVSPVLTDHDLRNVRRRAKRSLPTDEEIKFSFTGFADDLNAFSNGFAATEESVSSRASSFLKDERERAEKRQAHKRREEAASRKNSFVPAVGSSASSPPQATEVLSPAEDHHAGSNVSSNVSGGTSNGAWGPQEMRVGAVTAAAPPPLPIPSRSTNPLKKKSSKKTSKDSAVDSRRKKVLQKNVQGLEQNAPEQHAAPTRSQRGTVESENPFLPPSRNQSRGARSFAAAPPPTDGPAHNSKKARNSAPEAVLASSRSPSLCAAPEENSEEKNRLLSRSPPGSSPRAGDSPARRGDDPGGLLLLRNSTRRRHLSQKSLQQAVELSSGKKIVGPRSTPTSFVAVDGDLQRNNFMPEQFYEKHAARSPPDDQHDSSSDLCRAPARPSVIFNDIYKKLQMLKKRGSRIENRVGDVGENSVGGGRASVGRSGASARQVSPQETVHHAQHAEDKSLSASCESPAAAPSEVAPRGNAVLLGSSLTSNSSWGGPRARIVERGGASTRSPLQSGSVGEGSPASGGAEVDPSQSPERMGSQSRGQQEESVVGADDLHLAQGILSAPEIFGTSSSSRRGAEQVRRERSTERRSPPRRKERLGASSGAEKSQSLVEKTINQLWPLPAAATGSGQSSRSTAATGSSGDSAPENSSPDLESSAQKGTRPPTEVKTGGTGTATAPSIIKSSSCSVQHSSPPDQVERPASKNAPGGGEPPGGELDDHQAPPQVAVVPLTQRSAANVGVLPPKAPPSPLPIPSRRNLPRPPPGDPTTHKNELSDLMHRSRAAAETNFKSCSGAGALAVNNANLSTASLTSSLLSTPGGGLSSGGYHQGNNKRVSGSGRRATRKSSNAAKLDRSRVISDLFSKFMLETDCRKTLEIFHKMYGLVLWSGEMGGLLGGGGIGIAGMGGIMLPGTSCTMPGTSMPGTPAGAGLGSTPGKNVVVAAPLPQSREQKAPPFPYQSIRKSCSLTANWRIRNVGFIYTNDYTLRTDRTRSFL